MESDESLIMPRVWRFATHDESQVRKLAQELNLSTLVAQVLVARGYTSSEDANEFLLARLVDLHEPSSLPGIEEAVDRITNAISQNRRITIYGDYDVDGVTATSILLGCLKLAGATVDYYIPHRLEEGYGLNCDAIRELHEQDPHRLVITVDCGITSSGEAQLARELGLELIITDHHQFDTELPEAACLVHPQLPGSDYPFADLCGAGVAFKLAWGICQHLGDDGKATPVMKNYLMGAVGLAAIGTVADVVPLVGENRVLVRYGLSSLQERSSIGLQYLMKVAGIDRNKQFVAEDIAFAIAPRINAAGRLGQARLAVDLLTTENRERAQSLADYLDQLNKNRQQVERKIFKQAKELVEQNPEWQEESALVLAHSDWHPGVIGIVANRVAEQFEKPAILISFNQQDDVGQGSARSFAGFDLHSGLVHCADKLLTYGGHKAAAGLRIAAESIDDFRKDFCAYVDENHTVTRQDLELQVDAEVRLADLTYRAVREIDKLGPFGRSNARPVFAATRVDMAEPPKRMGGGDRHLSLMVRHYGTVMRAVAFGRGDWADEIAQTNGPISISFAPGINSFRGRETVELKLIDWQPGQSKSEPQDSAKSSDELASF